jgi:tripartite-type tricarboxylate transporter receptor subunit TctC
MKRPIRHWTFFLLASAALLAGGHAGAADEAWPAKPVRVIVPFPPGSATDNMARVVGQRMAAELKQPVIIDNRGGASGFIGADAVARGPADGYTLLIGTTSTQAVSVTLNPNLSYDPEKAFAPIGMIGSSPYVLVSSSKLPYKTFADLMADVRARPGAVSYASAGPTSMANLAAQLLVTTTRTRMTHVPYKSSAQSVTDTVTGLVTIQFGTVTPVLPHIRSGALTALAVTGRERLPLLPDVPTVSEAGVPGYEAVLWMGLFARSGTPVPLMDKLSSALNAALSDATVRDALLAQGIQAAPGSRKELGDVVRNDIRKWGQVVKAAGITGE